ncbi:MAG: TetR family transcriptional regulator [Alphaproteobacteria bacterium]|nr:TetR family transcriptional regulator [Alphaproteobacteria bacterium]
MARAAWTVIARDGLDRASLRAIAEELGCTTGVLTHYFRDKDALLSFALETILAELNLETLDPAAENLAMSEVRCILHRIIPLHEESAKWWRVWLSFTVASLTSTRQSGRHRALYARLRALWTELFRNMQRRGTLLADLDVALEAEALLCLVDGVGIQALISPEALTPARQLAIIDAHLKKITAR